MKSSPRRGTEVFDFKEEDELAESFAGKFLEKFKNPNSDDRTVLKHEFLECVAQETSLKTDGVGSVPRLDVDAVDCDPSSGNAVLHALLDRDEEKIVSMTECSNDAPQSKSLIHEECSEFKSDNPESRSFFLEAEERCPDLEAPSSRKSPLNCDHLDSSSSNESVDVTSDVDESLSKSSLSSPASGMAEDDALLDNYAGDRCSGDMEMDDMNMTVVLYPDYIIYRGSYCTGSQLIFSNNCIKIIGSTECENQEVIDFEWEIDDLINIECQWFQRAETVMIKLRGISGDEFQDDATHGTSGIVELKAAVVEPNWSQKQEDITSLNNRYLAVWNLMLDNMVMGTDGDDSPRPGRYFPVFNESFEDVIYPKGDRDAVSISKRDVDLLQPETFVNDTIIDFYIKYLQNQIQSEEKHRFHFFNSFFFRKLADLDKDPSSASDGKAAFQRVRKWTRKIDLFEKEFIFVPVNFSLHWSLIVICHPGEVAKSKDEDLDKSLKVPCILHMDSIKGNHAGLKNLIQSYLWEEWKERQKETSEEVSSRFHNLRFVSLELPQQENSFDCGLFLLHYLELFLAEVPVNFSPFKITTSSNFLNINWFPPSEASLKRTLIQRLIFELLEDHSREVSSSAGNGEDQPSKYPESNENEVGVEFVSARCSPGLIHQGNLPSSQARRGIEITLLTASSTKNSQCVDSGLVLRDLFETGASAGSLLEHCQSFDQKSSYYRLNGAISPLEEDADTGEQFMFLPSGDSGFHQMTGIESQNCGAPYSSKGCDIGISLQAEHGKIDSSSEPSICASDDCSDIGISETCSALNHSCPKLKEENGELKSPPFENTEHMTEDLVSASHKLQPEALAVEGSEFHDIMQCGNENGVLIPSLVEYPNMAVPQDSSAVAKNGIGSCDNVEITEDRLVVSDSAEAGEQPAKRLRLTPSLELEGEKSTEDNLTEVSRL